MKMDKEDLIFGLLFGIVSGSILILFTYIRYGGFMIFMDLIFFIIWILLCIGGVWVNDTNRYICLADQTYVGCT